MDLDPATIAVLDRQVGTVSRRQLRAQGLTKGQIDNLLRSGHLRRAGHGVYLRTAVGRSHVQEALLACLRARHGARVTGLLLLALLGCEDYDPDDVPFTILVPPGRRLINVPFPFRADPAPDRDHARYGPLTGTTPARTILELAVDLADDDALLLAADRLRWRCRIDSAKLALLASELPDHPGTSRARELGLLRPGRPETPAERDLAEVLAPIEPPLEWQAWVAPDIRVDALWRDCGVVLERDGWTHDDERDRARDAERDRRLHELGYLAIHVTAADMADPDALIARLLAIRTRRLAERHHS